MNHNLEALSQPGEEWRQIKSHPTYWISSLGRVYSGGRNTLRSLSSKSRTGLPYLQVDLWENAKSKTFMVHRLVAETFIGEIPKDKQVCHNDGNPSNNRADNLRIDSVKGNQADRKKHGTYLAGEDIPWAKLTELDVKIIRHLNERPTCTQKQIAALFGVARSVVTQVVGRRTWKHVPDFEE